MSATAIEDLKLALDAEILRIRWQKVIGTVWSPQVLRPVTELATFEVAKGDDG